MLRCINFDDATGRGTSQPVLLAQVGELAYLAHFRVFLYGRTTDRTVHYTVYEVPIDAMTG